MRYRACLRHAVTLREFAADALSGFARQRFAQGCRAGHDDAQAGKVIIVDHRMLRKPEYDGRDQRCNADTVLLHRREKIFHVET